MAARRLIMVLLVLLLVSSLAAALVPIERSNDNDSSTTTTELPAREPSGKLVTSRVEAGKRRPAEIRMHVGDQLQLTVDSNAPDQVEIPALDQVEPVDLGAPARFDLLADQARTYSVRLVDADRTIARIVVTSPPKQKKSAPATGSGRRS